MTAVAIAVTIEANKITHSIKAPHFLPLIYPPAGYQGHAFSAALAYPVGYLD
jgi:hypothetical protein